MASTRQVIRGYGSCAPVVMTYNEFYLGPMVSIIFETILAAVGFVLLIACANVAKLQLTVLSS